MTDTLETTIRRAIEGHRADERALMKVILPAVQKGVASVLRRAPRRDARDTRQELAELCQDVLLHLFEDNARRIATWAPQRGLTLPRYIELLARNIVIDILRARHKNPWELSLIAPSDIDALVGEAESPEQIVAREEIKKTTLAFVEAQLSEKGRAVLSSFIAGQTIDEVAVQNQMSTNAVYVWRTRITQIADKALGASSASAQAPRVEASSFKDERLPDEVS